VLYKLFTLVKICEWFNKLAVTPLFAILENFCIFLKASESEDIELPIPEKSKLVKNDDLSLGAKSTCEGVFIWLVVFLI
jgi:hypothetical protein